MLGAASLPPDQRAVLPLMPEPLDTDDGTAQNAGERHAAKRFGAKRRQAQPHRKCIVTADRLSATAPHIATLQAHGLHDLLGLNDGAHACLFQQVQAAEHAGRVTYAERHARAVGVLHRFRFVHDLPLHAAPPDLRSNCSASWELGATKVQHWRWVPDIRVRKRTVSQRMRGGRARWTSDNEPCNTLQNQGSHFEHNDGHGEQHLAVVLALLRRLAFWVDQAQQRCCALCQAVWAKLGSQRLWWERRRALFSP
jgi:hypothetical protein